MFQQVTLVGNLGADPIMNWTPTGIAVTNLSVATTEVWNDAQGQRKEETIWWRVTLWRKQAENAAQYLKKGSRVFITGKMKPATVWNDREGQPRASLEITANEIKYLDRAPNSGNYQQRPQREPVPADEVWDNQPVSDDIPF